MSRRESVVAGPDPRKAYLLKVASHILSLNLAEERLPNGTALGAFCNSEIPLLVFSRLDQRGHVEVGNELNSQRPAMLRAVFYKLRNRPLGVEDFKNNVNVLSMHESAGETLLGTLKQVFSRVLASGEAEGGGGGQAHIGTLLGELEQKLALGTGAGEGEAVRSLQSEIEFWQKRAQKGSEPALSYSEALEPLAEKLTAMEGNSQLEEFYELLGLAEQSVDALWNVPDEPFPQRRMCQLLTRIGEFLCSAIVRQLSPEEFFRSPESVQLVLSLTRQWRDTVELLTGKSWPQNGLHPWEGAPLRMDQLEQLHRRLDEAHSLLTLGEQVDRLLADREELQTQMAAAAAGQKGGASALAQVQRAMESSMAKAVLLDVHSEQQWNGRLEAARKALDPFIDAVMPSLRESIQANREEDIELVVEELYRLRHFLGRPQVRERLQAERQALMARLEEQLEGQRRDVQKIENSTNIPTGRFLTEIATKISWLRNKYTQTEKLRKTAAIFFDDLPAYAPFERSVRSLAQELGRAEEEQFQAWSRDMIAHVDDQNGDSISLQTTGRLMVLERARGLLSVSYSDRLARLLREVAQLQAMGFKVPSKIVHCAQQGEKFYQYGVLLKQVAHFYNTIEQQMLPCQQAMLLDEALAFERLVVPPGRQQQREEEREQRTALNLTWENPEKLKAYIEKLREAAFKLTSHNRRLRKSHAEICEIVLELGQTDLLREEQKWAAKLLEIRQKFVDEERFVAVKANMQPWANHWNRQLFKVVQVQFRWALENVQSQMPLVHVQLVFREQRIQMRPPLEELKQTYYGTLRKLLSTPQRLRGVQNNEKESEMFGRIVAKNVRRFQPLFEQSEQMFERLRTIEREFDEWTALAQANLEDLLEQHLQSPSDWEEQVRLLRQKQREAERIPGELSIHCLRVSTGAIRSLADDSLKRLHDSLAWTLRHSIRSELQSIEQKLAEGIRRLSALPQSLEEVAEANQTQLALFRSSAQLKAGIGQLEGKEQLLRSLFGADQSVGAVQPLRDQFTHFSSLLEAHEAVMREQVQLMKTNIDQRVKGLGEELQKLHALWQQFKPKSEIFTSQDDRLALVRAVEFIREKRQEFEDLSRKLGKLEHECEQFEVERPEWSLLAEFREDLEQYEANYLLYEDFSSELTPLGEQEWVLFRSKTYLFDEFLQKWLEKLRAMPGSNVAVRLQKDIEQMKEFSNCLKFCRGEVFGTDHWLEMFRLLGLPRGTSLERLTFNNLLNVQQKVVSNLEKLKELNARAHGEISIREAIQELEMWAAQAEFALADYKHASGASLKTVKEWKPVLDQVKNNQALLQSLRSSPYYAQFREQIQLWERKIGDLEQNLHHLNEIQRKWVYLEPIFGRGSLPAEAARFNRIDLEFRAILGDIGRDSRIASLSTGNSNLGTTLEQLVEQLNRCQRALNDFLEEKRSAFPRFYFLGDDDLLEIVGQSTNPAVIQSHLKKLFQGINRVAFDGQQQSIRAMVSAEGEMVQLLKPVQIVPKVEQWLSALTEEMRNTLRRLVVDCLQERALDPGRYPSQVLCLSEQIRFCSDVEKCLASLGGSPAEQLAIYKRQLLGQLERLSNTAVEEAVLQLKLKALVLDLVHHVSVLDQLMGAQRSQSIGCWAWQKQLRFYLVSGLVMVRQAENEFHYSYEYQGNAQKLVHTPLTDKCYLTLSQALAIGLGGNPYGPAGTGKTESVKALAGLMGRQVLVFNCDEGIDTRAIGRMFVGLIQCGAWGCFDEFNRLAKGVLSAVSSQVQTIQEAVRTRASHCRIGDHSVPVDTNSAIFITLNPAGKGYGGRQRLPDNLKQLFRPVAMSAPDNQQIAETLLFAEGFTQARDLARKMVTMFGLAREMLSSQQHYDWGLRALKTVLSGCADSIGRRRRELKGGQRQSLTGEEEFGLVVQNLQLNTLSKLTFSDARRFRVLLEDTFSGVAKIAMQFDELRPFLEKAGQQLQLGITEVQMNKLFELYEQLRQRIGVIIVGPPGSGKSTLWRLLRVALSLSGAQEVDVYSMNPKSMPRSRLLGHLEPDTREWADGTLSQSSRMATKDPGKPAWIVCDGEVDPEWIEALNSVLDDNRLLTIPSGERIQFGQNVNFLFECVDLAHASPATISRMGMILVSREDLDLQELIKRFLSRNEKHLPLPFPDWLHAHLLPALDWLSAHQSREFACSQVGIVQNALSLVRSAKSKNQFLVSTLHALLPFVEANSRRELSERVIFSGTALPDPKSPLNVFCDPRTDSLLAYTDDIGLPIRLEEMGQSWPVVMTARMQAARDILAGWLNLEGRPEGGGGRSEHILLVGPEGCGKECLLRSCFEAGGAVQRKKLVTMHCAAQTSAVHLEQLLMEHCVQISGPNGRVLKPAEHEQLLLHLKSPNLSSTDAYGTSMLVAFLEQLLDYNGFYDRNLEWLGLDNVQLVVSLSMATGMERFALPERFISKLRVLSLDSASEAELRTIYGAYLLPILGQNSKHRSKSESLAISLASLLLELVKSFPATDQFHYVFTPIDLTSWVRSLLRYELDSDLDLTNCLHFEALRIFSDRLVSAEHKLRFQSILQEHFPVRERPFFAPAPGPATAKELGVGKQMQPMGRADYVAQLEKAIGRLRAEEDEPGQILSDAFLEMCLAVDRALSAPGGSLLLAGRAGMGRRGAVNLVAQMHQMKLCSLRVSSAYSLRNFSQDLKEAIHSACLDNEQVVLLVEDYQLLEESFLQFINSLVASGYMPGLYTNQQELDQLLARFREMAMEEEGGIGGGSGRSLHDHFIQKVRQNVHLVLLMNTEHPKFAPRILSNPALYKHCTQIWLEDWTGEVATQIAALALGQKGVEEPSQWLLSSFAQFYQKAPKECRNPAKFVTFVNNFHELIESKRSAIERRLGRLKAGVDKLTETRGAVAKLQKKAAKKSKLLAEKQAEANNALAEITKSMTGANDQKTDMEQLKSATETENVKIEEQKKAIEQQLSEVEPFLREAREAVGSIKTESLTEVRSLRAPPEAIRDILQALLLFMGILDTSWEAMRKFLAKSGVKEEIINFDARRITPEMAKKVGALVRAKASSFDQKNARRASIAAAPLAAWVTANLQYALIIEKIAPLERKKEHLVKNLTAAEKQMEQLSKGLKSLDKKVDELKQKFEESMKEATEIKIELDREQATIVVAGKLVERLGGEYARWQEQMRQLEAEMRTVDSCCLLGAAFVTFLGGATEEVRSQTVDQWRGLCQLPEGFDPLNFLASETEQLGWKSEGMPSNRLALENGAILFRSGRTMTPFAIDPSGAICTFLASHFKSFNTELLRADQPNLMMQIELAVRFGKVLIVDEVEDAIEPALVPLLRREFRSVGARLTVQLGDKQVDFNDKFQLFLCTRNEHWRLAEHVRGALAEINFSTTPSGLSSQLLGMAIHVENPELERSSTQLSSQMEGLKVQLDQMEQVLLEALALSTGSLLDNTALLESLNASKEKAEKVAEGLAESEGLRAQIESKRSAFLPFVQRCAQLYFAIRPLHAIKHCYQFSVNDCTKLFRKCFAKVSGAEGQDHLEKTYRRIRVRLFEFVSRSLFKEDQLTFAMEYIHKSAPPSAQFARNEWELFTGILNAVQPEGTPNSMNSQLGWLEPERRAAVERIQSQLPSLFQTMQIGDQQTWAGFMKSTECENAYPPGVNSKLTDFQRVLVLQALRPDRLHPGIVRFASKVLGLESLNAPNLDIGAMHREESIASQPILLFISPGSSVDPSAELAEYAHKSFGSNHFHQMALGQQAVEHAVLESLRKCTRNGDWLCLQNVHLALPLTTKLLAEVDAAEKERQLHPEFRLWLTAEPDDHLPAVFLQSCLKAAYESPPGVRKNLERNYIAQMGNAAERNVPKLRAVFLLHWLHAIGQERRNFIPQGWLRFYEFSEADLRAAMHSLDSQFAIKEKSNLRSVDWEQFRGLMMNAIYGGRIEMELDNRVLLAFLNKLFNSEMVEGANGGELAPGLKLPTFGTHPEYAKWVESTLPLTDRAELLELPRNIMLSWHMAQSGAVLSKLRLLSTASLLSQPTVHQNTFNRQLWADSLGPLLNLWKRLHQQNPGLLQAVQEQRNRPISGSLGNGKREEAANAGAGPSGGGDGDPLSEILHLEFVYSLGLMQSVHSSLSAISRALKGSQLPERRTLEVAQALLLFQIPPSWEALWSGPSTPAQYLEGLIYKVRSTQALLLVGQSKQLLSSRINLAQLFRPGTLLNAFRQYSARKMKTSMDQLSLATSWHGSGQSQADEANSPSLTLSNLRIQGALFDGKELRAVPSSAAPFSETPDLHICWRKEEQSGEGTPDHTATEQWLLLPLFADVHRRELVLHQVRVPCAEQMQNAWILAGVALFLMSGH